MSGIINAKKSLAERVAEKAAQNKLKQSSTNINAPAVIPVSQQTSLTNEELCKKYSQTLEWSDKTSISQVFSYFKTKPESKNIEICLCMNPDTLTIQYFDLPKTDITSSSTRLTQILAIQTIFEDKNHNLKFFTLNQSSKSLEYLNELIQSQVRSKFVNIKKQKEISSELQASITYNNKHIGLQMNDFVKLVKECMSNQTPQVSVQLKTIQPPQTKRFDYEQKFKFQTNNSFQLNIIDDERFPEYVYIDKNTKQHVDDETFEVYGPFKVESFNRLTKQVKVHEIQEPINITFVYDLQYDYHPVEQMKLDCQKSTKYVPLSVLYNYDYPNHKINLDDQVYIENYTDNKEQQGFCGPFEIWKFDEDTKTYKINDDRYRHLKFDPIHLFSSSIINSLTKRKLTDQQEDDHEQSPKKKSPPKIQDNQADLSIKIKKPRKKAEQGSTDDAVKKPRKSKKTTEDCLNTEDDIPKVKKPRQPKKTTEDGSVTTPKVKKPRQSKKLLVAPDENELDD